MLLLLRRAAARHGLAQAQELAQEQAQELAQEQAQAQGLAQQEQADVTALPGQGDWDGCRLPVAAPSVGPLQGGARDETWTRGGGPMVLTQTLLHGTFEK